MVRETRTGFATGAVYTVRVEIQRVGFTGPVEIGCVELWERDGFFATGDTLGRDCSQPAIPADDTIALYAFRLICAINGNVIGGVEEGKPWASSYEGGKNFFGVFDPAEVNVRNPRANWTGAEKKIKCIDPPLSPQ